MKWFTKKEFECADEIVPVDGNEVAAFAVSRHSKTLGCPPITVGYTTDQSKAELYLSRPGYKVTLLRVWQLPDGTLVSCRAVIALPVLP